MDWQLIQEERVCGVTIHEVVQRAYTWMGEQGLSEKGIYSIIVLNRLVSVIRL